MVKVKVCGITRLEDATLAVDLGASAVGFVFWPESRRYIAPARAATIIRRLPADVAAVGVFVNAPAEEIRQVSTSVGLSVVQLHGDEPATFGRALPYRVLRAVGVDGAETGTRVDQVPAEATVLLDVHDPARRGGTGRCVDWNVAAVIAATRRVFLAGGLRPENVADAVRTVRPYGVDVSSGVEGAPGQKDRMRLRAFFEAVEGG